MKQQKWKYPRLSYSRLSSFVKDGPFSLIKRVDKESRALTEGAIVDDILFMGEKDFSKKYILAPVNEPTASTKILADEVIRLRLEGQIKYLSDKDYIKIIKRLKLWNSVKKEAVLIGKYNYKEFYKYIDVSVKAKKADMVVMSPESYTKATELVKAIRSDDNINLSFVSDRAGIENIFQYKLEFKYDGIKFLGYIDILQVDHINKTIQIKDLKTTSMSVNGFTSSFLKFNYYIQGGLYTLGLSQIIQDLKLEGYEVLPFEFIYSSFLSNSTITYVFTDEWLLASIYGFHNNGRYYKGIKRIISDIKWHFDKNVFDKSKYLYEHNSRIEIPSNFIKITEERYEGE